MNGVVDAATARALGLTPVEAPPPAPAIRVPVQRGQRGDDVRRVQSALNAVAGARLTVDGIFGPVTERAVQAFQQSRGLPANGVVDEVTARALGLL